MSPTQAAEPPSARASPGRPYALRAPAGQLTCLSPGDLIPLGARSLKGLNRGVDPVSMRLIDAGPAPAALAAAN